MTVRVYKSNFPGCSTIANTAGSLIAVLDQILVNGTSGISISSITRSGSTATVTTSSNHNLCTSAWMTIAGADQSEYNGDKQIIVTGNNTFTMTVSGTPATPATGTITYGMTAAGWTKAYSGTNLAAYQQGSHATNPNQFYLYVGDTTTTYASIRGYETMSSISDTTGAAFPTTTQASSYYATKGDGSNRGWIAVANKRTVYLMTDYSGSLGTTMGGLMFGDVGNYDVNDNYAIGIIGGNSTTASSYTGSLTSGNGLTGFHYVARAYSQSGTSQTYRANSNGVNGTVAGGSGVTYSNPANSKLLMSKIYGGDVSSTNIRGEFPGIYAPNHNRPLANGDTFTASGDLAGKRFIAAHVGPNNTAGQLLIEISNGW